MTIKSLEEAAAALQPYIPTVKQMTARDTTLDRIRPLMELLGNPQDRLKIIHLAGTSGKTSTAYYMAALLRASGKQVGLTVSPHVDSITERVQINGKPLAEAEFCTELGVFLEIVQQTHQRPSYFELLYAFTLWVLTRQNVDYAVVETGVGGLHDATNVANRADKVCIITDIGFDHMHLLGHSLPEIAAQKVGIVHRQNHVFMYQQSAEIMTVIEQWASQHHAPLQTFNEAIEASTYAEALGSMPDYQRRNWLLAYAVYRYLVERDGLPDLGPRLLQQTQRLQVPGRMDIKQVERKTIIMDGAHNVQKMTAFIGSFQHLYPDVKPVILIALKDGKEYQELVPLLVPLASRIIVTTFNTSQDLPVISMTAETLAAAFRTGGAGKVEAIVDHNEAFQVLLHSPEAVGIITGSFYLLSQIRNNEHLV
jgi:dihydrofolate synthase / folylpolyglutamate synthase